VEPKLCRTPLTKSIRKYFEKVGLPATIAGESFLKAVKEGRIDLATSPSKIPRGQTRGQMRLVPCQPPNDIDWQSVFVCVVAAEYCKQLKVPDGTMATTAVLMFLRQRRVLSKILGNLRTMMEKVANKLYLTTCIGTIYGWVREGDLADKRKKLAIIRELGGDLSTDLEQHTAYRHVHIIYPHHIPTPYAHYIPTPYIHIIYPHHMPTLYTHTIYPHHIPTPYAHII
jgi:hypothetical protein